MKKFVAKKISKKGFEKLNEDDVMFITNPGRMGDEDGSTFIIKKRNKLKIYRVDGWVYGKPNITLDDYIKQFPKWNEELKHINESDYNGKYKCLYMGFGNVLSVDNSIYDKFEPYLNDLIKEYLKDKSEEEKETLQYAAIYNSWEDAFINMVNDKKR